MQLPLIFSKSTSVGIFYKAGNGKVIKCRWKKLQNYDICENIGEVGQKALSGGLQVYDVACLGYCADDCWPVRFLFYLMSDAARIT
jgi:hypothetical protein